MVSAIQTNIELLTWTQKLLLAARKKNNCNANVPLLVPCPCERGLDSKKVFQIAGKCSKAAFVEAAAKVTST